MASLGVRSGHLELVFASSNYIVFVYETTTSRIRLEPTIDEFTTLPFLVSYRRLSPKIESRIG